MQGYQLVQAQGNDFLHATFKKQTQEHFFLWRNEWDMPNFAKIIEIGCYSPISSDCHG